MAGIKNDLGIDKTNNESIMTKPHWVDCNKKMVAKFSRLLSNRICACNVSAAQVLFNFFPFGRGEGWRNPQTILVFHRLWEFSRCYREFGQKQNIYIDFLEKGGSWKCESEAGFTWKPPIFFFCECVEWISSFPITIFWLNNLQSLNYPKTYFSQ